MIVLVGLVGGRLGIFVLLAALGMVVWLVSRKAWVFTGSRYQAGSFLPARVSGPGRAARIAEAVVLAAAAAIILAICATHQNTGGYLLILDKLRPAYATANIIMFAWAVAGACAAVLLAVSGNTGLATIVMAVVLAGYGLVLNAGGHAGSWFLPKEMMQPICQYTINIGGTNVRGAELWVNGVYLGKTPYTTTLDEFEAKVPYWPKPPADYETDKVSLPQYSQYGNYSRDYHRWIKFDLPNRPDAPGTGTTAPASERKTYYARVQYAGEWALGGGGGCSGGFGGGLVSEANSSFDVILPQRQKRIDALLNQARLADYRVTPEWFKAMETYNEDGWIAVRQAVDTETRMMEVLDSWATWRYGLDKVTDADSAWRVFEQICDEANAREQYLTPSIAGRAVELLVPKLPQDRLLAEAIDLISNTGSIGYFTWRMNDRLQFGYSQRPGGIHLGGSGGSGSFAGGWSEGQPFPFSGFPVAHAVWMLNEQLVAAHQPQPNAIQRHIVPALIRWQYKAGLIAPMRIAAYLGGPAMDQFLLRQNWQGDPKKLEWESRTHVGFATDVNKWLYLLAYLNDDAGREFRRGHVNALMDLADGAYEDGNVSWRADIDFVFNEPWLAKAYWPRFAQLARQKSPSYALETQWRYLLKMGDAATADMFAQAWKDTNIELDDYRQAEELIPQLKPAMRQQVVDKLVAQVESNPENIARVLKEFGPKDKVIAGLRERAKESKLHRDEQYVRDLQTGSPDQERLRKNIPLWLANDEPYSPLVKMLAESDKPQLRLMAMGALKQYPTPANRAILQGLLKDKDATVQKAAMEIDADLRKLAAQSPLQYSSDTSSAAAESSGTTMQGSTK